MAIADIVIIVFIGLGVLLGIARGFWRSFSKAVTFIIALVLGFMFASTITPLIFNDSILEQLTPLVSQLVGDSPTAGGKIVAVGSQWGVQVGTAAPITIGEALTKMLVPSFLHNIIISSVSAEAVAAGLTLGTVVVSAYTHLFTLFLGGAIIFLGSLLVLRIIAKLIYKAVAYKHFHKAFDRILGGLLRIVTSTLSVIIVLHVISMLSGFSFMTPVMDAINEGTISSKLYEADLLNKIFYGEGMSKLTEFFSTIIATTAPAPAPAPAPSASLIAGLIR